MSRKISEAARAAKEIKKKLRKGFSGIKFSVTSDNYAGGDSVRVAWTDGPTGEQIRRIAEKYQRGTFNGMDDIYEYDNLRDDIPQARFVHTDRTMSEKTGKGLASKHNVSDWDEFERRQFIFRKFQKTRFGDDGRVMEVLE